MKVEGIDYIVCPLCDKKLNQLANHFRFSHKDINYKEFILQNPNIQTISKKSSEKLSRHNKELWKSEERKKQHSDMLRENWKDPKYREKMINIVKDNWKDSEYREMMVKVASETMTETNLKSWQDDNYREWQLDMLSEMYNSYGTKCEHTLPSGDIVILRSLLEKHVANELDKLLIDYTYESLRFDYFINGRKHTYIPDFYIKELNLIIEVKPEYLIDNEINNLKKESVENSGYIFIYATDKFKSFDIYSATTIERIS